MDSGGGGLRRTITAEQTPGHSFSKGIGPPSTADDTTSRNFALQTMHLTVISLGFPQGEAETNYVARTNSFLRGDSHSGYHNLGLLRLVQPNMLQCLSQSQYDQSSSYPASAKLPYPTNLQK